MKDLISHFEELYDPDKFDWINYHVLFLDCSKHFNLWYGDFRNHSINNMDMQIMAKRYINQCCQDEFILWVKLNISKEDHLKFINSMFSNNITVEMVDQPKSAPEKIKITFTI